MKTFFEYVMTAPFPWERSSVAALRRPGRGACSASSKAEARSMVRPSRAQSRASSTSGFTARGGTASWSRVFMDEPAEDYRKNLTQRAQRTQRPQRREDQRKRSSEAGRMMRAAGSEEGL